MESSFRRCNARPRTPGEATGKNDSAEIGPDQVDDNAQANRNAKANSDASVDSNAQVIDNAKVVSKPSREQQE